MSWKKVRLGDIGLVQGGYAFASTEYKEVGIPLIRISNINNDVIEINDRTVFVDEEFLKKKKDFVIEQNDVLIALSGATTGKFGIYNIHQSALLNQRVGRIKLNFEVIDQKYFYFFLFRIQKTILGSAYGAAIPNISPSDIASFQIPLPNLQTQKHIASILDKADALRQQNRQLLAHYDALLQSTFIEMFGDPVENPKGWEKIELKQIALADGIKCGPFGSQLHKEDFQHKGVPLWGIKQVNKNFSIQTQEFLTSQKADELQTYSIEPYDIVMTRKGTIGNCAVYPKNWKSGVMHSDLLRIRVDTSKCHPGFLSAQLRYSEDIIHQISLISSGAIMAGINVGKLKKIIVQNPPILRQKLFSDIVEDIEAQKEQAKSSLAESEALFEGLLASYFGKN